MQGKLNSEKNFSSSNGEISKLKIFMKHLKRFNESIKKKNVQEIIDEILENLHDKKKLSKSERKFIEAASKGEVEAASVSNITGDFWSDMSNPHNLGTMWKSKDGAWKQIKSLDEEELERLEKLDKSGDKAFNFKKRREQEGIIEEFPEMRQILLELAKIKIENQKKERNLKKRLNDITSKIKDSDKKYNIQQRVDYAFKSIDSLENQFGYVLSELKFDEYAGEYFIK